jgi:hypothetical protein
VVGAVLLVTAEAVVPLTTGLEKKIAIIKMPL